MFGRKSRRMFAAEVTNNNSENALTIVIPEWMLKRYNFDHPPNIYRVY
jgi:hypothetical protein